MDSGYTVCSAVAVSGTGICRKRQMSSRPRIIEYSMFDSGFVLRVIRFKWGWERARCELWNRGVSDVYRVEHRGKRFYLKLYRHGWRTRAEIQGEVDLLRFLGRRDIRVVRPIRSRVGAFVEPVDAPEGRRYAVLFSEVEGVMPEFNVENSRKYGLMAGTVHNATDLLPHTVKRPYLKIDHLAREPLRSIHFFLSRRPRDLAYLTRLSGDLAVAVSTLLPASAPEFGMCHGDLTFGNVRRNGRSQLTLFDFDCSGYGWRAYDVAVFLQSRQHEFSRRAIASRMKQWNAFMDGYHAVRRLSGKELQAVNLFVPLRQIWQLGMHTNRLEHVGSRSMHEARFERHLEFIRNWLKHCKPL